MSTSNARLVIVSGPVGVGKTSVGNELSTLLANRHIPHTLVDLDGLAQTFPRPVDDPHGDTLALANLACVWASAREIGSKNVIVARVAESRDCVDRIAKSVSADAAYVVQLNADDETLLRRVRQREIGAGRDWHETRALALSRSLRASGFADVEIDTSFRTVHDIATELVSLVPWNR